MNLNPEYDSDLEERKSEESEDSSFKYEIINSEVAIEKGLEEQLETEQGDIEYKINTFSL